MATPKLKIIGVRGGGGEDSYYLIATGRFGGAKGRETELGFVAHPAEGKRWEPQYIDSILKFGYWEPIDHDPNLLDEIMDLSEMATGLNEQRS